MSLTAALVAVVWGTLVLASSHDGASDNGASEYAPGDVNRDSAGEGRSAGDVTGMVTLQGRTDHAGIEVTLVSGEAAIGIIETDVEGIFGHSAVPIGLVELGFSFPGYLRETIFEATVGATDLNVVGGIKLLGGDADGNSRINGGDLRLIGGGIAGEPWKMVTEIASDHPGDINGDGATDAFDLALAGVDFGKERIECGPHTLGDPNGPSILFADASLNPDNSLIMDFEVTVDTPSRVYVEYDNPDAGSLRSRATESLDTSQFFSVLRLRPSTAYCYEVFAADAEGHVSDGVRGIFETGPLPAGLVGATFTVVQGHPTYPLTLAEHNDDDFNGIVALDSQAELVWYHQDTSETIRGPGALVQNENLNLLYTADGQLTTGSKFVKEITPLGEVVAINPDVCQLPDPAGAIDAGGAHHEVLAPRDGKVLYLGYIIRDPFNDPRRLQLGDTIRQWDPNSGDDVQLWDAFDFLDPAIDRTGATSIEGDRFLRVVMEPSRATTGPTPTRFRLAPATTSSCLLDISTRLSPSLPTSKPSCGGWEVLAATLSSAISPSPTRAVSSTNNTPPESYTTATSRSSITAVPGPSKRGAILPCSGACARHRRHDSHQGLGVRTRA